MRYLALHGFTGDGADYSALSSFVGGDWNTPDLPGHGTQSDATEAEFALNALSEGLLGSRTSANPVTGIGYSMGGRLLLHLALMRPDAFSRLILIGASPGLRTQSERLARIQSDQKWIRLLRSESIERFFEHWWQQPVMAELRNLPSKDWENIRNRRLSNCPNGLARSLEHHGTGALPSLWERLPEITVPVQLIVGEKDRKFRSIAEEMANFFPSPSLEIIANSGHSPHLENPEGLAKSIRDSSG